jgi:hypothetical protein
MAVVLAFHPSRSFVFASFADGNSTFFPNGGKRNARSFQTSSKDLGSFIRSCF